jgi:hypothetical protein
MENIFALRSGIIDEYAQFSRSFTKVLATDILRHVNREYDNQRYWPEPLIQINPHYQRAGSVQELGITQKQLSYFKAERSSSTHRGSPPSLSAREPFPCR